MPRSKRDWTEEKRDRYLKEGRGQGSGRVPTPTIVGEQSVRHFEFGIAELLLN